MKKEVKDTHIRIITKSDGKTYSIRKDRNRYFFPDEWNKFQKSFTGKKKDKFMIFDTEINTGGRIEEILYLRPKDFQDINGKQMVRFWKTKAKAKKGESEGKARTIFISTEFSKRIKKHIKDMNSSDYIFTTSKQAVWSLLRTRLKNIGIKDWDNFGTHNLRKTHGMYCKALNIPSDEICWRLGHDMNTYLKHYGSPHLFSAEEIIKIKKIIGDLPEKYKK
jgi:integrase